MITGTVVGPLDADGATEEAGPVVATDALAAAEVKGTAAALAAVEFAIIDPRLSGP